KPSSASKATTRPKCRVRRNASRRGRAKSANDQPLAQEEPVAQPVDERGQCRPRFRARRGHGAGATAGVGGDESGDQRSGALLDRGSNAAAEEVLQEEFFPVRFSSKA